MPRHRAVVRAAAPGHRALPQLWLRVLAAVLPATGCAAPEGGRDPRLGIGFSAIPNIGLQATADWLGGHREDLELRYEVRLVEQFLDDEDFASDGNPGAGNWTGLGFGLRGLTGDRERRRWAMSVGLDWLRARGMPNVIDEPGDYAALRIGLGFETRFGERLSVGPELVLLSAFGEGEFSFVPQLSWSVRAR